jgi:hypothetical protein
MRNCGKFSFVRYIFKRGAAEFLPSRIQNFVHLPTCNVINSPTTSSFIHCRIFFTIQKPSADFNITWITFIIHVVYLPSNKIILRIWNQHENFAQNLTETTELCPIIYDFIMPFPSTLCMLKFSAEFKKEQQN